MAEGHFTVRERITGGPQHSIRLSLGVVTQTIWWFSPILMMCWRVTEGALCLLVSPLSDAHDRCSTATFYAFGDKCISHIGAILINCLRTRSSRQNTITRAGVVIHVAYMYITVCHVYICSTVWGTDKLVVCLLTMPQVGHSTWQVRFVLALSRCSECVDRVRE